MNAEMMKESQDAIEALSGHGLIDDKMATLLTRANEKDPDKARWIIATLANHAINPATELKMVDGPLSENDFARVCLLGVHRYYANQGSIPSAAADSKVQAFTDEVAAHESAKDHTKGSYYILQYLSRTTAEVGRACATQVETWQKTSGRSLDDLSVEEWYRFRHDAEKSSLMNLPETMSLSQAAFVSAAKDKDLLTIMEPSPQNRTFNLSPVKNTMRPSS